MEWTWDVLTNPPTYSFKQSTSSRMILSDICMLLQTATAPRDICDTTNPSESISNRFFSYSCHSQPFYAILIKISSYHVIFHDVRLSGGAMYGMALLATCASGLLARKRKASPVARRADTLHGIKFPYSIQKDQTKRHKIVTNKRRSWMNKL